MKPTTSEPVVGDSGDGRYEELKRALEECRKAIDNCIRGQLLLVRDERADTEHAGALEDGEAAEVDVQQDIELALVQMRVETIERIDAALARLEAGQYGLCTECGADISEARLRALPFAVRCVDCEESREAAARDRQLLTRRQHPFMVDVHLPIK
jgi:DnaK suppressor protein